MEGLLHAKGFRFEIRDEQDTVLEYGLYVTDVDLVTAYDNLTNHYRATVEEVRVSAIAETTTTILK